MKRAGQTRKRPPALTTSSLLSKGNIMGRRKLTRLQRVCEVCGKCIEVLEAQLKYGRGRFCSKPCQNAWQLIPLDVRFRRFVGLPTETGCTLWTGGAAGRGYGVLGSGGLRAPQVYAHRISYELANGPIPDGLFVLHNCPGGDNPLCVNPDHLFLGTQADNMADMVAKGRARKRRDQ